MTVNQTSDTSSIDNMKRPFGGYKTPPYRPFRIKGFDLTISRGWSKTQSPDRAYRPKFSTEINGKALLETDSVCIIDGEMPATKEFFLTIKSDQLAKQDWEAELGDLEYLERNRKHRNKTSGAKTDIAEDDSPESRRRSHIFELLNNEAPTASLAYYYPHYEVGFKGGWFIRCAISPELFARLEEDLLTSSAIEVLISMKWTLGLVDRRYADAKTPASWGLFRIGECLDPEPLRGHVDQVEWSASAKPLGLDQQLDQQARQEEQAVNQQNMAELAGHLGKIDKIVEHYMSAMLRILSVGFFLLLALILAIHFL